MNKVQLDKKIQTNKKKKAGEFEKLNIDTSEFHDDGKFVNIGGIVDTAETTLIATGIAADIAVKSVKATNNTRKAIQTGVVYSYRQGKRFVNSVNAVGLAVTAKGIAKAAPKATIKTGGVIVKKAGETLLKTGVSGIRQIGTGVTDEILNAKIDKTMVHDTAVEAAKQGVTYVRYVDNAVKTAQNAKKAAEASARAAKEAAKAAKATAKATAETVKTVAVLLTKKETWIVLAIALALFLCVVIVSMFTTTTTSVVDSVFGWTYDVDESKQKKVFEKYINTIDKFVEDKQKEIDETYYHAEFRTQFDYHKIEIDDNEKIAIIAIAATKWYAKYIENNEPLPDNPKLTNDQIREVTEKYYYFTYEYYYDHCSPGCKTGTHWYDGHKYKYCNVDHLFIRGKVENYDTDSVMTSMGFTPTQLEIEEVYDLLIKKTLEE